MSDGRDSNPSRVDSEARAAKNAGIEIFAIGITEDVDMNQMRSIASRPSNDHVFQVRISGWLLSWGSTHVFLSDLLICQLIMLHFVTHILVSLIIHCYCRSATSRGWKISYLTSSDAHVQLCPLSQQHRRQQRPNPTYHQHRVRIYLKFWLIHLKCSI